MLVPGYSTWDDGPYKPLRVPPWLSHKGHPKHQSAPPVLLAQLTREYMCNAKHTICVDLDGELRHTYTKPGFSP